MVLIGKSKFDGNRRVSLIKKLADLMDLIDGDEVQYYIEDGEVIVRKKTKEYPGGFDLEGEEIKERLRDYEESLCGVPPEEFADEDEARRYAEEQYAKDKVTRQLLKKEMEKK
ncbi:MAG: hypothetical protein FWD92_03275 [Methanomassiliicoccaceae archaeon]|nr:hypothetical protein [Methanomassiliicoccaceae archaeon]